MDLLRRIKKGFPYLLPSSTVLMFHHVTDAPAVKKSLLMNTARFNELICSFDNYSDLESTVTRYKDKQLSVTFDDALLDVYTVAFPFLTERNIPFTVFAATDLIGTDGYITTAQLTEMSKEPLVTVGSHCVTHTPLCGKNEEVQLTELRDSKSKLEELIGRRVTMLAYPFGQYDHITVQLLENNDLYTCGFKASGGALNAVSSLNKFKLPRLRIDDKTFEIAMTLLKKVYK